MRVHIRNLADRRPTSLLLIAVLEIVATLVIVGARNTATAAAPVPDHIGTAKLMMTLDEAKAAIPNLPVVEASAANSNPPPPFAYAEAKLADQQFGDLKPCNVTLRFFERRLINFELTCADKGAIEGYLLKTYGAPGSQQPGAWEWPDVGRAMTYSPANGSVTVSDLKGNAAFSMRLLTLAAEAQQRGSSMPPAANPPIAPQQ